MRWLTNLTLGKKIALMTTLGLVLGVGVFSFVGMRAVSQATETMLQERLTTAHLVADYLDEAMGRALNELKNTAQMVEIDSADGSLEEQIEALEDTYRRLSIYADSIYLLDEEGEIILSKPKMPVTESVNMSNYPSIVHAITKGEANISGLVSAPVAATPAVLLVSPTKEGQRRGKGVLAVAIDVARSSIGGFVKPIVLGKTGYVEIVDQNGIVVARTEPGPGLAPFEKSDHSGHFEALIVAGEPTRGLCHTCHEPLGKVQKRDVLAFVPLSEAQWGVAIRQSEEEALAPIRQLRLSLLLAGSGLVIITLMLVVVNTRNIVNHVRMLTNASQRIADGDLDSPVTTSRKDEIGILAQTFDDMRVKLRTSYRELEQLHREVQRKDEARSELLQGIFSIQEEERRRISRELHDETSQSLASLVASLEATTAMLPADASRVKATLRRAQVLSINILDDIHKLIYELRPTLLDDLGLVAAIRWLTDNNLRVAKVAVNFETRGQVRRLAGQLETTLFRVIQEAVYNIARHAEAKSADIRLYFRKEGIQVRVSDDGKGFDVQEAITSKDRPRGLGLLGMQERVELVNGTLKIRSRPGGGTRIDIKIPFNEEVANE